MSGSELDSYDNERNRRMVWRGLGKKSVRQVAEDTGLTVEQVVNLRNQLFDEVDALSVEQRMMKAVVDLQEFADRARESFETIQDERAKGPLMGQAISATKIVLDTMKYWEKTRTGEVNVLNELRKREISLMYEEGGLMFLNWLDEQGHLDISISEPMYQTYLRDAARRMDERNA